MRPAVEYDRFYEKLPHGDNGGVLIFPVILSVSLEFKDYEEGKILHVQ
jgi:hypothetical protein